MELLSLSGDDGVPLRATVTEFGPVLLSKVLELNETQESSLGLIFRFCDEKGLPLLDLEDLRAALAYLTGPGKAELKALGGISSATAGVLLRKVSQLEAEGGDVFFGEPAFEVADLLRTAPGRPRHRVGAGPGRRGPAAGAVLDLPDVGAGRAVRAAARGGRPRASRPWSSSSTRPTCCSTAPRRPSSTRSPRPCA